MLRDQFRLKREIRRLQSEQACGKFSRAALVSFQEKLAQSIAKRRSREENLPATSIDQSLPIFIIGNGSVSNEDVDQCNYLLDHIDALTKVFNSGIDLQGYLYYGLLDGFEWERGYASKRGLFHVDAKRLTRTPKPIALIFKELIATGTVRPSTLNQFVPERTS